MERKTLIARLRQLEAGDRNGLDIYRGLSDVIKGEGQREVFAGIADDEKRHIALGKEMLALLGE